MGFFDIFGEDQGPSFAMDDRGLGGINSLLSSHVGADTAAGETSRYNQQANRALDNLSSQPGFQNASVASALSDRVMGQAASNTVEAQTRGAQVDLQARESGVHASLQRDQQRYQVWKDEQARRSKPSFWQNLLMTGVSTLAGAATGGVGFGIGGALSNLINPKKDPNDVVDTSSQPPDWVNPNIGKSWMSGQSGYNAQQAPQSFGSPYQNSDFSQFPDSLKTERQPNPY